MLNIPTNTKDYIKVYKKVFEKDFCKKCIKDFHSDLEWEKHFWHNGYEDITSKSNTELSVGMIDNENTSFIMKTLWTLLEDYHKTVLKDFVWYNAWLGYSTIRYNKYDQNQEMTLHCDHIRSIFPGTPKGIPILSIVGVLNNDYEGGNFSLIDEEIILKRGSVVIFPSNFMYPHEVKMVTKGTRYSFVSWVY